MLGVGVFGRGVWGVGCEKEGAKHRVILQNSPPNPSNGQASENRSPAAHQSPFRAVGRCFHFLSLQGARGELTTPTRHTPSHHPLERAKIGRAAKRVSPWSCSCPTSCPPPPPPHSSSHREAAASTGAASPPPSSPWALANPKCWTHSPPCSRQRNQTCSEASYAPCEPPIKSLRQTADGMSACPFTDLLRGPCPARARINGWMRLFMAG